MAKKAKDKSLKQWLVPHLRNISRLWPNKNEVANAAKERVHIGFYKNGNPEYKVMLKCAMCKDLFDRSEIDIDHIIPVANAEGFKDWNAYIPALFCDISGLQALCKPCHLVKSFAEGDDRRNNKKK